MRIALIAMSGIRACDTELLRLGLTLPGFVERSKTIASLPSLGLLTLAGMTPPQHKVEYMEIPDLAKLPALPAGYDLAAISSYSAQIGEAYELAKRFRDSRTAVVLGGPHVTALPEEAREFCDAVVIGDGETAWQTVLADRERNRLSGNYGSAEGAFDLRDAPLPAYELLDVRKYNRLTVQSSRGCPHRCEFCAGSVLLGPRYRQKPLSKVLDEVDKILGLWHRPFIEFADDNSCVDKAYWRELAGALKPKGIRWFTETDISVSEDDVLLELMRQSGCAQVLIGLESPVETGLRGLELRSDWKFKRWPGYKEAIRNIQSHGISVNGCFVLGLDGHTREVFGQVYDFVRDSELYEVQITMLTAFPGTPLYARLKREGRILEDGRWDKCTLFDVNYRPSHMSPGTLAQEFRELGVKLYSDEFTRQRRENFRTKYLRKHRLARKGGCQ